MNSGFYANLRQSAQFDWRPASGLLPCAARRRGLRARRRGLRARIDT